MAETSKNKERLKEITDSIEQGIKDLFESEKYMEYLRTMSRFHRYSLNNTVLIAMQRPDATLVAGFNRWRDQFGRNVMRGEKGIRIIAPTPVQEKDRAGKARPGHQSAHAWIRTARVMTEEVEVRIPMYKVVSVFDVSQTEGKPLAPACQQPDRRRTAVRPFSWRRCGVPRRCRLPLKRCGRIRTDISARADSASPSVRA